MRVLVRLRLAREHKEEQAGHVEGRKERSDDSHNEQGWFLMHRYSQNRVLGPKSGERRDTGQR